MCNYGTIIQFHGISTRQISPKWTENKPLEIQQLFYVAVTLTIDFPYSRWIPAKLILITIEFHCDPTEFKKESSENKASLILGNHD